MKYFILTLTCLCTWSFSFSQSDFQVLTDSVTHTKMFKGAIGKEDIANDPSFTWYAESQKIYPTPNTDAVAALRNNKDSVYLIIFCGTWCEDTHFVLPQFFKIQEAAEFPENHMALYAVDRYMKGLTPLAQAMDVTNVPTIIVMKNGNELGRIVEYGKTGYWDKEFAEIFSHEK